MTHTIAILGEAKIWVLYVGHNSEDPENKHEKKEK